MEGQSFRFIHSSGFQLASTLHGITEAPDHLLGALIDAPLRAVDQVFEAAVREDVDFVVLSGDILDPAGAGPAVVTFLQQKFEQLRVRKMAVYWAASKSDLASGLLVHLEWPDNVHIFSCDRLEAITHHRGQSPLVTLTGRSWSPQRPLRAAEFAREGQEGFQIAVLYQRADVQPAARQGIHYWALGGSAEAVDLFSNKQEAARCPGSPQGFCPEEVGPHHCTLVSVDGEGEIRLRTIETDAVRWHREEVPVGEGVSSRDVRTAIRSRIDKLAAGRQQPLLVHWLLTGPGRFDSSLVSRRERHELLDGLREEFGHRSFPLWSLDLTLDLPQELPAETCDEDSIYGDFLRVVREQLQGDRKPPDLCGSIPQRPLAAEVLDSLSCTDPPIVLAALREAVVLASDVLRGDDSAGLHANVYSSRAEMERATT